MNGVAMARHSLILWENGATRSKKLFKHLQILLDPMFDAANKKLIQKSAKTEHLKKTHIVISCCVPTTYSAYGMKKQTTQRRVQLRDKVGGFP